jgi:probable HAF family extracellular repeat protein
MKSRRLICVAATTFALIAISHPLAAQEYHARHHHYKLVDLGTLGGPDSNIFGLTGPLNNRGMVSSCATTSVPDPNYPNINPYFSAPGDSYIQHTFLWQHGVLSDLGTLPGGTSSCEQWISDTGLIVGGSTNGLIDPQLGLPEVHATLWLGRRPFDLGTLGGNESIAFAVNNFGQVAGGASNKIADSNASFFFPAATQVHAVLWKNGEMMDLGTLGEGTDSMAYNVNELGQVAGMSFTNNTINATTGLPTVDIFLWENGKMIDLGTLGGVESILSELNNKGQIAGYSNLEGDMTTHPVIGDRTGMKDLGTFGGDNGTANWLNDEGQVVGTADFPGDVIHHAFIWQDGVMTDLGTVDGDGCSNGVGINSLAEAVGTSTDCHGSVLHLFLWERGSMLNLSGLILLGSDVIFNDPTFINDRGEIAGNGVLPNGDQHAVLLIPCDGNHAGVEGCDYGLVDANTLAKVRATQVPQHSIAANENHDRSTGLQDWPHRRAVLRRGFSGVRSPNN